MSSENFAPTEVLIYLIIALITIYLLFIKDKSGKENHKKNYSPSQIHQYQEPNYNPIEVSSQNNDLPIITKVVGVTYENRQAIIKKMRDGESLILQREPDNDYDKNAIKVIRSDGQKIGYLNKDLAVKIQQYFNDTKLLRADVMEIVGKSYKDFSLGVVIKILPPKPVITQSSENIPNNNEETKQLIKCFLRPGKELPYPIYFYDDPSIVNWYIHYFATSEVDIAHGLYNESESKQRFIVSQKRNFTSMNSKRDKPKDLEKIDFEAEYEYLKAKYNSIGKTPPSVKQ